LKKQLAWLKLDNARIGDSTMPFIGKLTALTRLQLSNTGITDKGLASIGSLEELQSLNLVNVRISLAGLLQLRSLKNLKHLYLYQSGIRSTEFAGLQKNFPAIRIDTGGYKVPLLATDTIEVKQ
jgi:Leucine-rich repeat (LRR) protein